MESSGKKGRMTKTKFEKERKSPILWLGDTVKRQRKNRSKEATGVI